MASCMLRSFLLGAAMLSLCWPAVAQDADNLTHANAQKAAMEKATVSLQAAAEKAAHENPDSKAVSVVPERRDGRPVAAIKLLRPRDLITAMEPLN
jgi:hypothetical protein